MIDQKLIDEINEKTPIVDLVSEFVSLSKKGKNYMGLCPFHQEKTPSFSVSPEKNIAKCMGCGEGGSPINFYRKIKQISFDDACHDLAERAGIVLKTRKEKVLDPNEHLFNLLQETASFYQFNLKNSEKGHEALKYLQQRQMTIDSIDHFRLGYAPPFSDTLYQLLKDKGYQVSDMIKLGVVKQKDDGSYYDLFSDRVIFPITDFKGRVVGFSGRTMNSKESIKYINSPETSLFKKGLLLYHFYEGLEDIRKTKQIILYEGFFDVISSYMADIKNGVATMGTALTKDQAKLMKQVAPSVLIAYDGDNAGQKATDHAIPILESQGLKVEVLEIPDKMDPDEFIKDYGPEAYDKLFYDHISDPYQFRYQYYRKGKKFDNANDVKLFKNQIIDMIKYADTSIQAMYQRKLSLDLNMPLEAIEIPKKVVPREVPYLPPKKEIKKILNKFEKAERYLVFAMLRSREVAMLVKKSLKVTDFADHMTANIRLKIANYYDSHVKMDVNDFLDTLTHDEREHMINHLFMDTIWLEEEPITDEQVTAFIEINKLANDKRRLDYLIQKVNDDNFTDADVEERDMLMKKLKTRK
ncbi:MAG: DNA primase [Tenericutes bacterium HGW-Tenericutes-6]|nr:MAG: DNA primase [Tenericutes bacterium HGW-Tenericutes-6]